MISKLLPYLFALLLILPQAAHGYALPHLPAQHTRHKINIASLQDTSTYASKQASISVSGTYGYGASASVTAATGGDAAIANTASQIELENNSEFSRMRGAIVATIQSAAERSRSFKTREPTKSELVAVMKDLSAQLRRTDLNADEQQGLHALWMNLNDLGQHYKILDASNLPPEMYSIGMASMAVSGGGNIAVKSVGVSVPKLPRTQSEFVPIKRSADVVNAGLPTAISALDELGQLPSFAGKTATEIGGLLQSQGYKSVPSNNGGVVWTKELPDGNTAAVRVDPPTIRDVPKGFADEVPHAHKEIVPTSAVSNGNYKPNKNVTTLDDACCATKDPSRTHIPIR